jgi:DNA polymerase-1
MQQTGFAFDRKRAARISDALREAEQAALARADDAVGRTIKRGKGGSFSTHDLRAAFFEDLRAPVFFRSEATRAPSLNVDTLRAYAAGAREDLRELALAVIEARRLRKVRSTYVERILVHHDGRVRPSWHAHGTVSGRWTSQDPNLANLPRPENDPSTPLGGVRSLYVAPRGRRLVYFDASQLEMRIAAYASGDPAMMKACESSDLHAANAALIFGAAFTDEPRKSPAWAKLRSLAKQSGFAVCYLAEAETVLARLLQSGVSVSLRQVQAMLRTLRRVFGGYFGWQARGLNDCTRTGYVATPLLGRRRWLGHDPKAPECANFPIQGGAADFVNARAILLARAVKRERLDASLVAYAYDALTWEVRAAHAKRLATLCRRVFEAPVRFAPGRSARLPIDCKILTRWE